MKYNIFSPDEFAKVNGTNIHEVHCSYVNEKLNKLIESWPIVYTLENNGIWHLNQYAVPKAATQQARLALIEEIKEPCKHATPYRLAKAEEEWRCATCGVELQATWSEKK